MITRRTLLTQSLLFLGGCAFAQQTATNSLGKLAIGAVAYGEGARSLDLYQRFVEYLEKRLKTIVELEPAYNEVKAMEQIQRQNWALVFAPSGLAAIAVAKANYLPLFPLHATTELRILHTSRRIPSGSVLISPTVERNQQRDIEQAMNQATPAIAQQAGYIPNVPPPDYKTLISFIDKVKPIESHIREKPTPLYQPGERKTPA